MSFEQLMGDFKPNFQFSSVLNSAERLQGSFSLKNLNPNKAAIPLIDKNGRMETSGYSIGRNKILSNQEASKFINNNKDLIYVIDQDKELQKELSKVKVSNREDLIKMVAKRAHGLLNSQAKSQISEKDLVNQSSISSMIVLNTAGIKDIINEKKEFASFFADGGESITKTVYKKLADLASALFPKSHPLNDTEFFTNNPRAAIYMLGHKDVTQQFFLEPNGDLSGIEFKKEVNSGPYEAIFNEEVNKLADQMADLGSFNESYFDDQDNLATLVAATFYVKDSPNAAQLLRTMPEAAMNNLGAGDFFNFDSFLEDLVASQVTDNKGSQSPLSESILKNHFGIARLMDASSEFKKKLNDQKSYEQLSIIHGFSSSNYDLSYEIDKKIRSSFVSSFQDFKPAYSIVT
ncbi:MAG: hypothetical protein ACD_73C00200G0003 [uncultured bacterium]|nr:MAG: hypothetical protein ACD_73C00200G0003 [uncultured bacterium]